MIIINILNKVVESFKLLNNSIEHLKQYKNLFGTCMLVCEQCTHKNKNSIKRFIHLK